MSVIPVFFTAKQVNVMQATPQTAAANGTLSAGTAFDLHDLGIFDFLDFTGDRNLFELSPADAFDENYVHGKRTFNATLSQLDKPGKDSKLFDVYGSSDYIRVEAQATPAGSGAVAGKKLVIIAAIGQVTTGWREQRNVTQLPLRPCGIAAWWGTGTPPI